MSSHIKLAWLCKSDVKSNIVAFMLIDYLMYYLIKQDAGQSGMEGSNNFNCHSYSTGRLENAVHHVLIKDKGL